MNQAISYFSGTHHPISLTSKDHETSLNINHNHMAWALVTPASRGIGFALTRHILTHTNIPVIATARKDLGSVKKSLLSGLDVSESRLHVLPLDVTGK